MNERERHNERREHGNKADKDEKDLKIRLDVGPVDIGPHALQVARDGIGVAHEFLGILRGAIKACCPKPTAHKTGFARVEWHGGNTSEGVITMSQGQPGDVATFKAEFATARGRVVAVPAAVWSSSDDAIATVSAVAGDGTTTPDGLVTLVADGEAIIKCSDPDPDPNQTDETPVDIVGTAICRQDNTVTVGTMTEGEFAPPA